MYIVAIETTGPVGSVAVIPAEDAGDCGQSVQGAAHGGAARSGGSGETPRVPMKVTTRTMSHLRNLMKMTEELFDEEGISGSDIAAVAVSVGPGSFTGIRIGVSTGRALAQAWGVPCISVPTLEVFREKAGAGTADRQDGGGAADGQADVPGDVSGPATDGSVAVIFNARRGQVYGACFDRDGEAVIEPGPYMLDEMLERIGELGLKPLFYGDGLDAYLETEEFSGRLSSYAAAPAEERYQTAVMVARYAKVKYANKETIEYGKLMPDYMRESEAEQRLRDGSLEKMRKAKLERLMNA